MAASDEVDTLFEEHLQASWTQCQVIYENDDAVPHNEQDPWVYVANESDDDDQASIGGGEEGNLWREIGRLNFYVIVPAGSGRKQGRQLRDGLADLFKGKQIAAITCRAARRNNGFAWDGEQNGNWYAFPLVIDWYMDS